MKQLGFILITAGICGLLYECITSSISGLVNISWLLVSGLAVISGVLFYGFGVLSELLSERAKPTPKALGINDSPGMLPTVLDEDVPAGVLTKMPPAGCCDRRDLDRLLDGERVPPKFDERGRPLPQVESVESGKSGQTAARP
jgi:hypothetical protein